MLNLILASASPRRAELLDQLGLKYSIRSADIDETPLVNEQAAAYVKRLAFEKANAVFKRLDFADYVVLGADTAIEIDGEIVGKPIDFIDAKLIWTKLMGREHLIHTAFCLLSKDRCITHVVTSSAIMQEMTEAQMKAYWQTGEPKDKAGSYAIQGIGAQFISFISGSYSAIMGLPLFELSTELELFGIRSLELGE